jgi:hypothetical protein
VNIEEFNLRVGPNTTDAEIGEMAREITRATILHECEKSGLTVQALVEALVSGLSAKVNKEQFDPQDKAWYTSPGLDDHGTRLKAVTIAKDILGLDAPKKMNATVDHRFLFSETKEMVGRIVSRNRAAIENAIDVQQVITASFTDFSTEEDDIDV